MTIKISPKYPAVDTQVTQYRNMLSIMTGNRSEVTDVFVSSHLTAVDRIRTVASSMEVWAGE